MSEDDVLIDEFIDEQGDDYVAEEKAICQKYMDSDERLLAVFSGNVDGEDKLDRMMLTDKRVIFYSRDQPRPTRMIRHSEIESVKTKKGKVLTHLGEILFQAKGELVAFKDFQAQYIDYITNTFSSLRTGGSHALEASAQYCTSCGSPLKLGDKFCRNCGKSLT